MKSIEIIGKNSYKSYTKSRTACRGIIIKDGKLLACFEKSNDLWILPGGGIEESETLEECCCREIEEETGYIVKTKECIAEINEYYEDFRFISFFFTCEIVGEGKRCPTQREIDAGAAPHWINLNDAIDEFSKHQSFDGIHEEKRGIYLREYSALMQLPDIKERQ